MIFECEICGKVIREDPVLTYTNQDGSNTTYFHKDCDSNLYKELWQKLNTWLDQQYTALVTIHPDEELLPSGYTERSLKANQYHNVLRKMGNMDGTLPPLGCKDPVKWVKENAI